MTTKCDSCGRDKEGGDEPLCPRCRDEIRDAFRKVDALQQVCADRPDLVRYVEGLIEQLGDGTVRRAGGADPEAEQNSFKSATYIRWRGFVGKSQPHFERCTDWQLSEKVFSPSGSEGALDPQADWQDSDLSIQVNAVSEGLMVINVAWKYGPAEGGLAYNCHLEVSGWEKILSLHWLRRALLVSFDQEPKIQLTAD